MEPVCLVIGAGAGIGGNVARRFARGGYHAVLCRRSNEEGLQKLVQTIHDDGGKASGFLLNAVAEGTIEERIIEMPEDLERTELRDSRSGFIAYVPVGSIAKGRALVRTGGNGRTQPCGVCHGDDLRGLGPVPSLAGRSPSYLVRQLYDLQTGVRKGRWSPLMQAAVAKLSVEDFVALAAYAASLEP